MVWQANVNFPDSGQNSNVSQCSSVTVAIVLGLPSYTSLPAAWVEKDTLLLQEVRSHLFKHGCSQHSWAKFTHKKFLSICYLKRLLFQHAPLWKQKISGLVKPFLITGNRLSWQVWPMEKCSKAHALFHFNNNRDTFCAQSGNKCCPYLDLSGSCACGIWPKVLFCKMLVTLPCFKSWFFQIISDCDRVCIKVSVTLKIDFCCGCAQGWNRVSLLFSWGFLRTGLAQEHHLLCITMDGYFCTKFLSGPWIHRQVFLLAMVSKKRDNICSIIYLQLFPILILFYWNTTKFSD